MRRLVIPIIALALGATTAFGLVSCGGDEEGLLPGDNAEQIVENLNSIEELSSSGECASARDAAEQVEQQIDELGNEVNTQLKQELSDGADRLVSVIDTTCVEETTTVEEPTTTTEETTTEPTTTETTTTETTTEPTTTTTTPPTTTVPPTVPSTGEGGGVTPPTGEEDDG